jgi:S1-C subfamily serine protease
MGTLKITATTALIMTLTNAIADENLVFPENNAVPVSAPLGDEAAAKNGSVAILAVFRILCREHNSLGTGFLHKSGNVITASHVVNNCKLPSIIITDGREIPASVKAEDDNLDVAIVSPSQKIDAQPLLISTAAQPDIRVGLEVSTWGFPGGYFGLSPMLSVGYMSGIEAIRTPNGSIVKQWVVNAAFNRGNSGGPLLSTETGDVIGIVDSKVAPISPTTQSAITALSNNQNGFMYSAKMPDGKTKDFSDGQVVATVLDELRNQVQLVIGHAILNTDIIQVLRANNIDP